MKCRGMVDDTLLFWRPSMPAVYIGYHQLAYEDIDVNACRQMNIPIIRRILGGGTGYCDENQIIYNVIFKEDGSVIPLGPRNVYKFVLGGVVGALHNLGIDDVTIDEKRFSVYANGRKISGSGQLTSNGVVNSSGSFLIDFDFKRMNELLRDPVKNLREGIKEPDEGMTHLKEEIGEITINEVKTALRGGFDEVLGKSYDGALISYESELAEKLRDKYLKEEWTFRADMRDGKRKRSEKG
jgi:lipoate-protein ligase A